NKFGSGDRVWETITFGIPSGSIRGWYDITGNLPNTPVNTIALGPDGSTLFVGTDVGVYQSCDGGDTWYNFGMGLPNAQVVDLEYVPSLNVLAAATHGHGVYEIMIPPPTVNVTGIESVTRVSDSGGGRLTSASVTFNGHTYDANHTDDNHNVFVR